MRMKSLAALCAGAIVASTAGAQQISITIENTQSAGGFSLTPFWLSLHDGGFDVFDAGAAASGGITEIAEVGDTSVLSTRFSGEQSLGVQTTLVQPDAAPVFSPGESASVMLDAGDATVNRFFSYAAMFVPSNDLFVGNDSAIELFDAGGNFNGPVVIEIYGRNIWDNGSELNDVLNGGAFVNGVDGSLGAAEGGVITSFFDSPSAATYIASIVGTTTADGGTITHGVTSDDLIARITIVPAPSGLATLLVGGVLGVRRRR